MSYKCQKCGAKDGAVVLDDPVGSRHVVAVTTLRDDLPREEWDKYVAAAVNDTRHQLYKALEDNDAAKAGLV
jgi:hypothetical protein